MASFFEIKMCGVTLRDVCVKPQDGSMPIFFKFEEKTLVHYNLHCKHCTRPLKELHWSCSYHACVLKQGNGIGIILCS